MILLECVSHPASQAQFPAWLREAPIQMTPEQAM